MSETNETPPPPKRGIGRRAAVAVGATAATAAFVAATPLGSRVAEGVLHTLMPSPATPTKTAEKPSSTQQPVAKTVEIIIVKNGEVTSIKADRVFEIPPRLQVAIKNARGEQRFLLSNSTTIPIQIIPQRLADICDRAQLELSQKPHIEIIEKEFFSRPGNENPTSDIMINRDNSGSLSSRILLNNLIVESDKEFPVGPTRGKPLSAEEKLAISVAAGLSREVASLLRQSAIIKNEGMLRTIPTRQLKQEGMDFATAETMAITKGEAPPFIRIPETHAQKLMDQLLVDTKQPTTK